MRRMAWAMLGGLTCGLATIGCASEPRQSYNTESRLLTLHTQPEGARVTSFAPFGGGGAIQLGTTPLVNQPVMVLTRFKASFADSASGYEMMSRVNTVRLRIEKDGYQPWEGSIATSPTATVERTVTLEPTTQPTAAASR